MKRLKSQLGVQGEEQALEWLKKHKGFIYLDRNFHTRWGEIDLIMRDRDQTLVFVEVKSRVKSKFGSALEQIDYVKLSHLKKAIEFYLHKNNWDDQPCRVDGL